MILLITILLLVAIFFTSWSHTSSFEPLNYLLRSLQHADFLHLFSNLYSFWQLRDLTTKLGPQKFAFLTISIWVISSLILYLIHKFIPSTKAYTIGFSAVVLGLLLVRNYYATGNLFEISIELLINIIPHFLIPGISFWGHLSGLMAGIIYSLLQSR